MTEVGSAGVADPGPVWATIAGYQFYWAAVAGVQLGVFDALTGSPASPADLASRTGCAPGRVRSLADVLVASGLLSRTTGEEYAITDTARTFLVSGSDRSMTDLLLRSPGPWQNWPGLAATVQGADPPAPADAPFYAALVRATFPTQYAAATVLASRMPDVASVLDVGAGAAPWSIALLEASPAARATAVDLAEVVPAAGQAATEHGVRDRMELVAGDYWDVPFDPGAFDVVVLGHVLRAEGDRAPDLVARAAAALAPGGTLVVADYFVDDDRRGPVNSLLLGLTMMTATPDGRTSTRSEHRSWFAAAGLTVIEERRLIPGQEVMTARRPEPQTWQGSGSADPEEAA